MILRLYLFTLYLSFLVSAALAALIIMNVNPFESPFWMIGVFYIAIFLIILSVFALTGFYLKVWASNREIIYNHIKPTLRQGAFVGLAVVGILFLQQLRVLNWWVGGLYLMAIILIELFFKAKR